LAVIAPEERGSVLARVPVQEENIVGRTRLEAADNPALTEHLEGRGYEAVKWYG
jgi:hypothetical protein